jgi:branched-chain amino acid transport system substrate-binding protein
MATHTVAHPYLDDASDKIRLWATKYKTMFNENPDVFSVYGYLVMDQTLKAIDKTGPNLNVETFIKAMDSLVVEPDMFGADRVTYTPTKHLGSNKSRLSVIKGGRWTVVSPYVEP